MEQELETIQQVYNVTAKFIINYSFQILGAIIILIIGSNLAGWFGRLITGLCEKRDIDITLSRFLGSVVKILTLVFVIIIAIGKFGISIAPFYCRTWSLGLRHQLCYRRAGFQLWRGTGNHLVSAICDRQHDQDWRRERSGR